MADLTPDRLARLRVWATRHNPDRADGLKHRYYAFCPWCSDTGDPDQPDDDGNAHDLAIELLDEIDRLRAEIEEWDVVDLEEDLIQATARAAADRPVRHLVAKPAAEPDRVVDLMAALEESVAVAKEARRRHGRSDR